MELGMVMASSPAAACDIKALREYLRRLFNTEKLDGLDQVQFTPARQASGNMEKRVLVGTWGKWSIYAAYRYTLEGRRTSKRLMFLAEDEESQMYCHGKVLRDYVTYVEPFLHVVPLEARDKNWFSGVQASLGRYIEACFILKGLTVGTSVEINKICRWLGVAVNRIRKAQHLDPGFEDGHKLSKTITSRDERLDTVVEEGLTASTEDYEEYPAFDWSDQHYEAEKKLFETFTAPFDLLRISRKQIRYQLEYLARRENKVMNDGLQIETTILLDCDGMVKDLVNKSIDYRHQLNKHQRKYDELEHKVSRIQLRLDAIIAIH